MSALRRFIFKDGRILYLDPLDDRDFVAVAEPHHSAGRNVWAPKVRTFKAVLLEHSGEIVYVQLGKHGRLEQ